MPKKMTKKVVKKNIAKKIVKKVVKAKKVAPAKVVKKEAKPIKVPVIQKPLNRSQVMRYISAKANVGKKHVMAVMDSLAEVIEGHLKKRGPGEFTLLGLAKFRVVHKPATKARQGINPFTGKPMVFEAKPARSVVKIRPLKKMKNMAE